MRKLQKSIGGWKGSDEGGSVTVTPAAGACFFRSILKLG